MTSFNSGDHAVRRTYKPKEEIKVKTFTVQPGINIDKVMEGAHLPAKLESWRYGFLSLGEETQFRQCDFGPFVAYDAAKAEIDRLRAALAGLVGTSDPVELRRMKSLIGSQEHTEEGVVSLNAIRVLLEPN